MTLIQLEKYLARGSQKNRNKWEGVAKFHLVRIFGFQSFGPLSLVVLIFIVKNELFLSSLSFSLSHLTVSATTIFSSSNNLSCALLCHFLTCELPHLVSFFLFFIFLDLLAALPQQPIFLSFLPLLHLLMRCTFREIIWFD